MTNQEILDHIRTQFANDILAFDEPFGMLTIEIPPAKINDLLVFLRDSESLQCAFLTDLCGMHFPNQSDRELGMVYMVHSWTKNIKIRIKSFVSIKHPHVPTITGLYAAANWMERETFDFYGIKFDGHPDLRRIMNVDEMDYHPQRKEFPLEDGTRTDKEDQFFGREGNYIQTFDHRADKQLNS
ncbi:MAG: NADH-quinone oxidoreductase subunit C [Bacteroidetes bacterium]|nr:NADH-quinone oxidoreductase subunit C [Bacteroidota bacterium]